VNDLQSEVAAAADRAEAHSTAPALLLQTQSALGRLSASADAATEGGRRPYRVPSDWSQKLGELAYLVYLLADQTGVSVEDSVRSIAARVSADAARRSAQVAADDSKSWI
jgi:hypothetical protein